MTLHRLSCWRLEPWAKRSGIAYATNQPKSMTGFSKVWVGTDDDYSGPDNYDTGIMRYKHDVSNAAE
jgi:hypothetical protein